MRNTLITLETYNNKEQQKTKKTILNINSFRQQHKKHIRLIPAADPNSLFASMRPERQGVTLCILSHASTSIINSTITSIIISSTGDDGDGAKHSEGAIETRKKQVVRMLCKHDRQRQRRKTREKHMQTR